MNTTYRLGIMMPGIGGAIGSTLAVGLAMDSWSNATSRYGFMTEGEFCDKLDLAPLYNISIGGWDTRSPNPVETCERYQVFADQSLLDAARTAQPPPNYSAVLSPSDYFCIRRGLDPSTKPPAYYIKQLSADILNFQEKTKSDSIVVVNLSSPPMNLDLSEIHGEYQLLRERMTVGWDGITSGMLYSLAAIESGCPYVEFTPAETITIGALQQRAHELEVPVAGRDASTGQTLLKSVLARTFKARNLLVESWYSTNILGNLDGLVLSDPDFSGPKLHDKRQVLPRILDYPVEHLVDIRYVESRGDRKEAWDSVELRGWLNQPLSLRINWLGRDSILAAPLVLDLARLLDSCKRQGLSGVQSQLGVFFKNPIGASSFSFHELYEEFRRFCAQTATKEM